MGGTYVGRQSVMTKNGWGGEGVGGDGPSVAPCMDDPANQCSPDHLRRDNYMNIVAYFISCTHSR